MALTFEQTKRGYAALWDKAKFTQEAKATAVADRIISHKDVFLSVQQATGVPWWMVGCMLYRESNLDLGTYLGNGQSLSRVTTEVPAGRGPFRTFLAGAIDAIELEGMQKLAPWTLEKVLYWLERFNGEGYFGHNVNDPYLWSWTNLYDIGKFDSDGHFNAGLRDPQGGCAAIMKALFVIDPASMPPRETALPSTSPTVTPSTQPATTPSTVTPMDNTTASSPNTALQEIDKVLSVASNELPTIIGFLSTFIPQLKALQPFLGLLPVAINAVHEIEKATGQGGVPSISAVVSHLTPGQPNAPALGQQGTGT